MSDDHISQAHRDAEKRAQWFEDMAARIRTNKDAVFGGAFMAIGPGLDTPVQLLVLNQDSPGIFWSAMQTMAQEAVAAIDAVQRKQGFR